MSISFTNLRVNIDEKYHSIYTELTSKSLSDAEDHPFIKMPDLFISAACVGAHENIFSPIQKRKDIFVADAFDSKLHLPVLFALAYQRLRSLDGLNNAREVLTICEGWANGGLTIIDDQIRSGNGLRPLYRLIDFALQAKDD